MPASTPRLALPYPTPDDSVDVPRDVQALATKLDVLPKRNWRVLGDGSGDGVTGTPWVSDKSPTFTVVTTGWHRVRANLQGAGNPPPAAVEYALQVDAGAALPASTRYISILGNTQYVPVVVEAVVQVTAGQVIRVIYHAVAAGQAAYMINSTERIPVLFIEEVDAPS